MHFLSPSLLHKRSAYLLNCTFATVFGIIGESQVLWQLHCIVLISRPF
uniref:Uncharacterized protein n=1 Tax=Rhizophora mucronata TaxID=61149 RepID=A0A2P2NPF7_RHIMU